MALENNDLFVIQKEADDKLYKLTVDNLISEVNVQSDWTNLDSTSDAFIQNKPNVISTVTAGNQIEVTTNGSDVTISSTAETLVYSGVVDLTGEHTLRSTPPLKQDLFLNTGEGTISASWAAEITNASAGDPCFPGDFVVYNQTNYELISAGGPPTTDSLWVESAGKLFPANLGNRVGIGTDDPVRSLHVKSSSGTFLRAESTNTGSGNAVAGIEIKTVLSRAGGLIGLDENDNELWYIGRHYDGGNPATRLDFDVAGSTAMSIPTNGNVGIGRTNPQSPLEVGGNGYFSSRVDANKFRVHDVDGGSALSPSIMPGYDNDTGFFQPVTNNIGFSTFGVERMRITDLGNVGIGTDNPTSKLDVNGTIISTPVEYTNNQDEAYLIAGTTGWTGDTTNWNTFGFQHRLKTNDAGVPRVTIDAVQGEAFCVKDNGNVGIGTSDPQVKLDVNGGATFSSLVNAVKFKTLTSGSALYPVICVGDDNDNGIFHPASNNIGFTTFGVERMRINDLGNVGIGTDSPQALLDVNGSALGNTAGDIQEIARFRGDVTNNSNLIISNNRLSDGADWLTTSLKLSRRVDVTDQGFIEFTARDGFADVAIGSGPDEFMRLTSDGGYVGIGTSDPQAKLDVKGTIEADDLTINGSSFRNIPQNSQTSAYTLLVSDIGKVVCITTGGVTIPSGVFSSGDAVTIYNDSGTDQTITQGSGVTLRTAGTSTDGDKTLAGYGLCTVLCVASDVFVVSGAGLS